ncbi:hypothetical protein [Streptomyces globosus]|uniref:hypothetical protein n=1 Tax=Streptomyces globosus TaxID=68209 RepID=UPI00363D6874
MKMATWPALTVLATGLLAGTAVPAAALGPSAEQRLDGSIAVAGNTCTWTNARTSANPLAPSPSTAPASTPPAATLSCAGGITATLNNDPQFTFDDAAGTARTDVIDITGKQSFISCRYKAAGITWNREGDTRKYVNQAFTATKVSGSFLCPGSVTTAAGGASMLFR